MARKKTVARKRNKSDAANFAYGWNTATKKEWWQKGNNKERYAWEES